MFTVFVCLFFRLHPNGALRSAELNSKFIKENKFGCGTYDLNQINFPDKDGWNGEYNGVAPVLQCSNGEVVISQTRIFSIHKRTKGGQGLFEIVNSNFKCTTGEIYSCSGKSPNCQLLYFEGTGTHTIDGTRFIFCGLNQGNDDVSLIYIKGSSSNKFSSVHFDNPSSGNPQPWEITSQRPIYIEGTSTLTVFDGYFRNCSSNVYGGAFKLKTSGNVDLTNCKFNLITDRHSSRVNGIYFNAEGKSTLTNCNFTDCGTEGAVLWSDGNNIEFKDGIIGFTDITKSCCGFYMYKAGNYKIDGVTFLKCGYGGRKHAILYECAENRDDEFSISDCTFDNCHCDVDGRAIRLSLKIITSLSNCKFINFGEGKSIVDINFLNTYKEFTFSNNLFENNVISPTVKGGGAGIYIKNKVNNGKADPLVLYINTCYFINNYCKGKGGAYQIGDSQIYTTSIIIDSCEFTGNNADGEGGALCIQTSRECNITNCKFTRNKSKLECGCIFIESDVNAGEKLLSTYILNCNFQANYGTMSHCIYFKDGTDSINEVADCTFNGNYNSAVSLDAIQGTCILSNCKELHIYRNKFINDDKDHSCGGVNVTSRCILDVQHSVFQRCNAGAFAKLSYGGGIGYKAIVNTDQNRKEDITIYGCIFDNNAGQNGVSILIWASTYPKIENIDFRNHDMSKYIFCIFFMIETKDTDYLLKDIRFTGNSCNNGGEDMMVGGTGIWIAETEDGFDYWDALNLVFDECRFEYNYAPGNGGAFGYEGSARLQGVELTFNKCKFSHNSCGKKYGGACNINTNKPVSILECEFYNNSALGESSGGGALSFGSSIGLVTLYKNIFRKCTASAGAFIYTTGKINEVNISYCSFSELEGRFNSIYLQIESSNSLFNFESNTFDRLKCKGNDGGSGIHIVTNKDCEITSCHFISCTGDGNGNGQITIPDSSSFILTFYNCTFEDPDKDGNEGGRAITVAKESGIRLDSCIFTNFLHESRTGQAMRSESKTKSNAFYNCSFENIRGWSCIHFEFCKTIDMESCHFSNVKAGCSTGIIYQNNALEYKMNECTFLDCGGFGSGEYNGGAIIICNTVTNADFANCTFTNCWTLERDSAGGAIRANGNAALEIIIEGCKFTNCTCKNNVGSCVDIETSKNALITNNVFKDNTRKSSYIYSLAKILTFENNTIEDVVNGSLGSGLTVGTLCTLKVINNLFKNTHSESALLYMPSGSEKDDVLIEGNTWDGCGGGNCRAFKVLAKDKLIFRNNTIKNSPLENIRDDYIGWIQAPGKITIENCKFLNNNAQAQYGGGIGLWLTPSSGGSITVEFNGCEFKNNRANMSSFYNMNEGKGGAIQIGGQTTSPFGSAILLVYNCHFENNVADREGGAISLQSPSKGSSIDNCTFINNQAGKESFGNSTQNYKMGGAIFISSTSANGDYAVTRCTFKMNKGGNNGHAIYCNATGKVTISEQCTFIDNINIGGSQISNSGTNFILTNCIIELSNYLDSSTKARGIELLENGKMHIFNTIFRNTQMIGSEGNAILINQKAADATIENVTFTNCGKSGYVISCSGPKMSLLDNIFDFTNPSVSCGCLSILTTGDIKVLRNYFQKTLGLPALKYVDQNKGSEPNLLIDSNIFEKCQSSISCFDIVAHHEIKFQNNFIQNNNPGKNNYLGSIDFRKTMTGRTYTFSHNKFINNSCSSYFGGGSGFWCVNKDGLNVAENAFTLQFENCYFENNHAIDEGRASANAITGHGGALQFGWTDSESPTSLIFTKCQFIKNNADKHGGALSIQVVLPVEITDCVFDGNKAGLKATGADSYLYNIAGALYFEPDFPFVSGHFDDMYCESIKIINTTIKNNDALNASAIYVNGGAKTTLTISGNCQIVDNGKLDSSVVSSAKEMIVKDSVFNFTNKAKRARGIHSKCKITTLSNVKFENNYFDSQKLSHAFYLDKNSGELLITGCDFYNCGEGGDYSSTMQLESAPIRVEKTNIHFSSNANACRGMTILSYGDIVIENNIFNSTLSKGSLVYAPQYGLLADENMIMENNIFDNCDGANTRCFSIKANSGNVLFRKNIIQNCPAKTYLGSVGLKGLDSFTFDQCIFRNLITAAAYGGGTGLWVTNDRIYDLIFKDCLFENCHAKYTGLDKGCPNGIGGGLQYGWSGSISNVNVKLFGCTFEGNKADRDGGAVCLMVQGTIDIENCSFYNNFAGVTETNTNKYNGGAIALYPNYDYGSHDVGDTININNCSFIGNHGSEANCLYVQQAPRTSVYIQDNCVFTDNTIEGETTANSVIVVESKLLSIDSITINFTNITSTCRGIETNSTSLSITSSKFYKCAYKTESGNALLILPEVSKCTIESCVFTNNGNKQGSVIETKTSEFIFDNCVVNFTDKSVSARGLLINYGCRFYLLDSQFVRCSIEKDNSGGAFEYQGLSKTNYIEEINILSCTFDDNSNNYASCFKLTCAVVPIIKDITVKNHQRSGFIVVVLFSISLRKEITVDHWNFENNYYKGNSVNPDCGGSGLWIAPAKTNPGFRDSWPLTFSSCTWKNNHAGYVGGAFAYGNSGTLRYVFLNFTNCQFIDNYCDHSDGGALWFNSQVPVKITSCTFTGNYAKGGEHKGHALYISTRCTCNITNSKFIDNGNSSTSSVIQVSGTQIDLIRCEISFTNGKGCRGIFIDYPTIGNFINSTFLMCNASGANGGAIYLNNKDYDSIIEEEITIEGCTFEGNLAGNGCAMLLNLSSVPKITRNTFINQNSGNYVLSIFFTSFQDYCVVDSCIFQNCMNNKSEDGGGSGIWIANMEEISKGRPAELIFRNCVWENNTTPNRGGALHYGNSKTLVGVELTFEKCTFAHNSAFSDGGAVSLVTKSRIVFNECQFSSNIVNNKTINANTRGCSIFISSITPLVQILGCKFTKETANDGNAIYLTKEIPACFISGCTFNDCGTTGTVVVSESKELLFQNTDIIFTKVDKACRGLDIKTISITTITKSKFIKCKTPGNDPNGKSGRGGGIYLANELKSEDQEEFVLEECTFDGCQAANGCAMLLQISSLPSIRGVVIQNHKSGNYIMSIFGSVNFQDVFTIESCTFYNNYFPNENKQDGGGSGFWMANDQNLLPGTPTKLVFRKCNWTKNSANYGGAISYGTSPTLKNTEMVFEGCRFESNIASSDQGGALYLITLQPILIDGCSFIKNQATGSTSATGLVAVGGACYFNTNATSIVVSNTLFDRNSAVNGNAIWTTTLCPYIDVNGCDMKSNSNGKVGSQITHNGVEIHVTNTKIRYETTTQHSRGIEVLSRSKSYFVGCTFYLCETDGNGGGLYIQDQTKAFTVEETLTLSGCTFDSCDSSSGAALLCNISCNPTVSKCTITNIQKGHFIFVIYIYQHFMEFITLDEITFKNNQYSNSAGLPDGGGCGFWIAPLKELYNGTSSKIVFNNCNFIGNKAAYVGGAISYGNSQTLKSTFLQFKKCSFINNSCDGSEGGALWVKTDAQLLVSGCAFKNNKANGLNNKGGTIYVNSPSEYCQIYDSTFESVSSGEGNAIYSGDSTVFLQVYGCYFNNCGTSGSVITSNAKEISLSASNISFDSVDNSARGLEIKQKTLAKINKVNFTKCKSTGNGGGIFIDFSAGSRNESLSLTGCIFDNNNANGGCAIWGANINVQPTIDENIVMNCRNEKYIFVLMFSTFVSNVNIEKCEFENNKYNNNNSPQDSGGCGIWIANNKGLADNQISYQNYINCRFENNEAVGVGGAYSLGFSATVKNTQLTFDGCSFVRNKAGKEGGALYIQTKQPVLITNCKFDSNQATSNGGALYIATENANVTIEYTSLARNNAAGSTGALYIVNSALFEMNNNTFSENVALGEVYTFYLKNEGHSNINKCIFDFTRTLSEQYQVKLSGQSAEGSISIKEACFTHKGFSDETLTHIKSDTLSSINLPSGNCFDVKESSAIQHSGEGVLSKANGIFDCKKCDGVYVPTIAPEPTPKATPQETPLPSDQSGKPSASQLPTLVPTAEPTEDEGESNKGTMKAKTIGMIAGIAAGAVVIIIIIVVLVWLFVCRNRTVDHKSDSGNASEMNDETITGITGIDSTNDDPIWAGAQTSQDNPLFNGGDDFNEGENIPQNDFEESWGNNGI